MKYGGKTVGKDSFIWSGKLGRDYVDRHPGEVIAIIDNNEAKQGTKFNDEIPIISISDYLNCFKDCSIVITVFNCKEIIEQLRKLKIYNYRIASEVYKTADVPCDEEINHDNWINYLSSKFNKKGMKVLEIGSRIVTGSCNREKFNNAEYVGFDIYSGLNVYVVGDAHKLSSYFNEKFDLIFSSAVFEHLAMPWVASLEIIRLLKVGGYVFIETHYSFSSHERPWHFFQFSENALDVLFPQKFGMKCEKKGCSNLIEGKFSDYSSEYLQGRLVEGLYCHSEYLGKKVSEVEQLSWDNVGLEDVTHGTLYPSAKSDK